MAVTCAFPCSRYASAPKESLSYAQVTVNAFLSIWMCDPLSPFFTSNDRSPEEPFDVVPGVVIVYVPDEHITVTRAFETESAKRYVD